MKNIHIIQQAVDFIEKNLKQDISLFDISKRMGYSLYHFIRLFQAFTGHSPKDYLLRRRITEAAKEIRNTRKKLIDIAFDYQFGTPETFSRAFKRILGANPSEIRKRIHFPTQSFLTPLDINSLQHAVNAQKFEVEILKYGEIKLAGLVTLIQEEKAIIQEMWVKYSMEIEKLKKRIQPERYVGYSFWSNDYELDGFFHMVAVEMQGLKNIQIPLCMVVIPPCRYLKFIHKGPVNTIGMTYKYIFQTFLPKSEYKLSLPYDLEIYNLNGKPPLHQENITEILIPIE
jgi:AraC family transcriptional regulator